MNEPLAIQVPEELPAEEKPVEPEAVPHFAFAKVSSKKFSGKINIRELQIELEKIEPSVTVQGVADAAGNLETVVISAPLGTPMKELEAAIVNHKPEKTDREETTEEILSLEQRVQRLEDLVLPPK